jgi:hypothetical protein
MWGKGPIGRKKYKNENHTAMVHLTLDLRQTDIVEQLIDEGLLMQQQTSAI